MYFFVHMSESSREKNLSNCNCLKLSKIDILKISGIIGEINSQISPKRKKVLLNEMALLREVDEENLTKFIPRHLLTPALFLTREEGGN